MRNLPDDELYDALEKRLGNYSEPPDDEVWIKIARALSPSREPGWIVWTNRMTIVFLLATPLLFLMDDEVSKYETLRTLHSVENSATEPNGTKSALRSTETQELDADPIKENEVRETEKLAASGHRANKRLTMKPPLAENRSVILENPTALPESPSLKKEDLWNKRKIDNMSDTFQVIMKSNADSVRALIQIDSLKKERGKRSRITVYMLLTPSLSFHHVSPISNDDVVIEELNSPAVLSMDRLGISVEGGIQGLISKRFQYIAGVSFYHQTQRIQYEQQSAHNVVIESGEGMSYAVSPGTLRNSFDYNMTNIGIQAGLLYTLKQHGLVHKAGIVFHYQKGLQRGGQDVDYNNASSNYLHYQLFYRIEYTINPKMSLVIQPGYTHSVIANESLQAPFRLKQSRAGIGIGIVYSF